MKNKAVKIPFKRILLYLCVTLFLATGVTFSKYITRSEGGDGARVARFGELALYETENGEKVNGQTLIYAPGVTITKNPAVDFARNELAAYVFVKIEAPNWHFDPAGNRFALVYENTEKLTWSVNTAAWTALSGQNGVYYTYVPAGVALSGEPIIQGDQITVAADITRSEMEAVQSGISTVTFTSYAVQANGFENAAAAWSSVSAK